MTLTEIKPFLDYGIIAGLFIFQYITIMKKTDKREDQMRSDSKERENQIMKDSKEREEKLYDTLNMFSSKYDIISQDLKEIKDELKK